MRGALTLKPSYYEALKRLTLELAGVNLGADHAFLVETRLAGLAQSEGYASLDVMIEELFNSGQTRLAVQVVSSLVERDMHFFRDPKSFDHLTETVLPKLYAARGGVGRIRVLSFACSSGQEAYGVAMRTAELKSELPNLKLDILGVDYPSQALDRARAGRYTHFEVQRGLPIQDLIMHFDRDREDWVIKKELREKVEFKEMHLLSNLDSLGKFHVVMFRGALTHYSAPAQVRVLRGLANLVQEFGYLVLGTNETLNHINYGFDKIHGKTGLFRKREDIIEEPEPDPNIKVPTDRKTFERAKRRVHSLQKQAKS
ncbi:CheR family methyltransferase [Litorimonas sp. RW-G-Af-16]|uniref:CheR family methyltransferase n=1 Tax=Litorimonas sp. RW-G-Af-16 TaxID=3241168 RepID=UPI00390C89E9